MSLETGDFPNDLNSANPPGTDPKSQGDDHIRLVKKVLKEGFAGFTGIVICRGPESGTAADHVVTPVVPALSYTTGMFLSYTPTNVGVGGALTVNVSALGAKSVKTIQGDNPSAGDVSLKPLLLQYDGTNFVTVAGSVFLSKTGNQTITGNITHTGNTTQTGNLSVSGSLTVSGALSGAGFDTKANVAGQVFGPGTFDFSAAASVIVPTATLNGQAINLAQLMATAFMTALPGQPGGPLTYNVTSTNSVIGYTLASGTPDFLLQKAGVI